MTDPIRSAVVTGATGHLGNVLVRRLLERGVPVTVVLRAGCDDTALEGLDVRRLPGDVTDAASLQAAFRGADVVFHVAGLVSITAGREAELTRVNVEGTRHVVEACVANGVRRLVYTSSVHALPEPDAHGALTEAVGFHPDRCPWPYSHSKARASKLVQDAAQSGRLDAVLVLPTGVIGPFDFRLSEVGQLVSWLGRGWLPLVVGGGYDWVDVRDVAEGTLLAAHRGRRGEAYLLSAGPRSVKELARAVSEAAGIRPPWGALPLWLLRLIAPLGLLWERLTGRRALVTPYSVHTVSRRYTISGQKAADELGLVYRPVEDSLRDAWVWLSTDAKSPMLKGRVVSADRTLR